MPDRTPSIDLTPWDGLAWALLSPSLVLVLLLLPAGPQLIGRFTDMLTALGAELPVITTAVLAIGDPWVFVIAVALVGTGTGALLRVRANGLRAGLGSALPWPRWSGCRWSRRRWRSRTWNSRNSSTDPGPFPHPLTPAAPPMLRPSG
jgi:hypothetical protein